jgi:hypothetical protein
MQFIIFYLQALNSRLFLRGFDRVNLHRPTGVSSVLATTLTLPNIRGSHSFTLELNLSNSKTHS